MKIVKHGKFVEFGFPMECPRCGCVFELSREEFINSLYLDPSNNNETGVKHYCPECELLIIYPKPPSGFMKDMFNNTSRVCGYYKFKPQRRRRLQTLLWTE